MSRYQPSALTGTVPFGTLTLGILGSILVCAALPPWNLWPLAWLGPVFWIVLIRRVELPGRRPYTSLWAAGCVFWLAALHWLRLPYWETAIGWVALSLYLGCYLPAFVCLSRIAVHRLRVPVIVAAPVVWAGLGLAQAHLLSGFRMAALAHSQYRWITLLQIADLGGEYAVDFLIVLVAACFARMLRCGLQPRIAYWPLLPAALALAATLGYGYVRTSGQYTEPAVRVALIQGSIDTEVKADPSQDEFTHRQYITLSQQALIAAAAKDEKKVDVVVWPETEFRKPYLTVSEHLPMPAQWTQSPASFAAFLERAHQVSAESVAQVAKVVRQIGAPAIFGVERLHLGEDRVYPPYNYNSALLLTADGKPLACYNKMHPVLFGEYMPFVHWIPWLQRLTPVNLALDSGEHAVAFPVGAVRFCPSICYESVLSHVIRGQVAELKQSDQEPQVLVNLTNDGWFWGSSELDMHLICGVFRAVECRKPLVIAANTGFSAWIDGDGRILAQGPRRATGTILADVRTDLRTSPYLIYGDIPTGVCLVFCTVLMVVGVVSRRRIKKDSGLGGPGPGSSPELHL